MERHPNRALAPTRHGDRDRKRSRAKPEGTVRIAVLLNDRDVDGDPLSVTAVTQPTNGTATLNADGSIEFVYNSIGLPDDSATVGIQNGDGTDGLTVRRQAAVPEAARDCGKPRNRRVPERRETYMTSPPECLS